MAWTSTRLASAAALLATLMACGRSGGADKGLYVVFEDIGEGNPGRFAFLPDGEVYFAIGQRMFRLEDGATVEIDPGVPALLAATDPAGGVLVAHVDGFVWTDDGDTWEPRADAPEGLRLTDMLGDRVGAIYATYAGASGSDFEVHKSTDGGRSFTTVDQFTTPGIVDTNASYRLSRANRHLVDTWYTSVGPLGSTTIPSRSEDGGRTWVELPESVGVDPGAVSFQTSDGVQLARQTQEKSFLTGIGWHTDWTVAKDQGWRPVRYIGIPGYSGPPDTRFTLDPQDHLLLPFGGRIYRTTHPISKADPGAAVALPGPGCRGAFELDYDANINFEPAAAFTVENTLSERIDVWEVDFAVGFQHRLAVEPGATASGSVATGKHIYVRDIDQICIGVEQVTADGATFVF